jgi:hypothetical protein
MLVSPRLDKNAARNPVDPDGPDHAAGVESDPLHGNAAPVAFDPFLRRKSPMRPGKMTCKIHETGPQYTIHRNKLLAGSRA